MTVLEAIAARRSVRRFSSHRPERSLIERLLEAGLCAPSASNKQPWRFFVTDSAATIVRMGATVEAATARIAARIPPDLAPAFGVYGDYFVRFREAPVVIVVAYRELHVLSQLVGPDLPESAHSQIAEMERQSGAASAAMAVQNMLLAAPELGLGASCMTGPMVAGDELKHLLGIPASWRIAAVVPVGYPDEAPASPGRKPLEAVVRWVD